MNVQPICNSEGLLKAARSVANCFIDKIKVAGIVVSNEDVLRQALVGNMTVNSDFPRQFMGWADQGRQHGVTFYASAAGVDQLALVRAFIDAYMTRQHAELFIANLRSDPPPAVLRLFSPRAES